MSILNLTVLEAYDVEILRVVGKTADSEVGIPRVDDV